VDTSETVSQIGELGGWEELKEWMATRGFVFRDTIGPYQRMNVPIYRESFNGVTVRITFVWGRDSGFRWLKCEVPLIDAEHWGGLEYITRPIYDGYQIKISATPRPEHLPEDDVCFMGYPQSVEE
jgi:hypothetical protein